MGQLLLGLVVAFSAAAAVGFSLLRVGAPWQVQAPFIFYRFDDDINTKFIAACLAFARSGAGVWALIAICLLLAAAAAAALARPSSRSQIFLLFLLLVVPPAAVLGVPGDAGWAVGAAAYFLILWLWGRSQGKVPLLWRGLWLVSLTAVFGACAYFQLHKADQNLAAYHLSRTAYPQELELYAVWGGLAGFLALASLWSAKFSVAGVFYWLVACAAGFGFYDWSNAQYPDVQVFAPATRMKVESKLFPPDQWDAAVGRVFTGGTPIAFSFEPRPGQVTRLTEVFPNVTRTRVSNSEAALETLVLQDWLEVKAGRQKLTDWLKSVPFMAREPIFRAALDATLYDPFADNFELMNLRNSARDAEDFGPDLHRQILLLFSTRGKRQEVLEESAILLESARRVNRHVPGHFDLQKLEDVQKKIVDRTGADDRQIAGVKGRVVFDPLLLDPGYNLSTVAFVGFSYLFPADLQTPVASPLVAYFPVQADGTFDVRGLGFAEYAPVLLLMKEGFADPRGVVLSAPVSPGLAPFAITPGHPAVDLGTIQFVRGLEAYSWFRVK